METENIAPESEPTPPAAQVPETATQPVETTAAAVPEPPPLEDEKQRQFIILAAIVGVIFIVGTVTAIVLLALPSTDTEKIRDIFIILLALLSMVIGVSLIVMMIQLARLINLMQNEVIPILEATEETVNTLRGTTAFLSENMVEPIIKLNEYLAALRSAMESFRILRR